MTNASASSYSHHHPSDPPASGRAIAALVFGILGVIQVAPFLGPILALFLASGEPSSTARTARILGWIGIVLFFLALFLLLLFFGLLGGLTLFAAVL